MMLVDNKIEFMVQVYLAEYYSATLAVKGDDRDGENSNRFHLHCLVKQPI